MGAKTVAVAVSAGDAVAPEPEEFGCIGLGAGEPPGNAGVEYQSGKNFFLTLTC